MDDRLVVYDMNMVTAVQHKIGLVDDDAGVPSSEAHCRVEAGGEVKQYNVRINFPIITEARGLFSDSPVVLRPTSLSESGT